MIIVTGGAGFIGSALVWGLNRGGLTDILIVDQQLKGSPKERNLIGLNYRDYLESDELLRRIQSSELGPITAVFHQGACSSTTEMNRTYLRDNNTDYTRRLAEWCLAKGVYFSYASSAAAYGEIGRASCRERV
jgi:ADP-L-glycero-D-manno-heptose 6-epimerase